DMGPELNAIPDHVVCRAGPDSNLLKGSGHIQAFADRKILNRYQTVSRTNAALVGGAVGYYVERNNAVRPADRAIDPGDAIVGQMELTLLLEIDNGATDRRNRKDHQ